MRLLFIEDQIEEAVEPILKKIRNANDSSLYKCETCEFQKAEDIISSFQPDVVILDLFYGQVGTDNVPGDRILDSIWERHFCPVVVYSARPEEIAGTKYEDNPFVTCIKKGSTSTAHVLSAIKTFQPHITAIKEAEQDVRHCFAKVMRDVSPYAIRDINDEQYVETIKRTSRRRIAALMDEPLGDDTALAPWEQYLFPPISNNIQMGDLLMEKGADCNKPNAFRVVLSPSCDLVSTGRKPKVKNVLVAKCCSMKVGLKSTISRKTKLDEMEGDLPSALLNQGYQGAIIPFPALEKHIPTMAANLRNLDLISIGKIGDKDSDKEFHRVASIDSPFREIIAWAYMQIACRPGLPDRDTLKWAKEIVEDIGEEEETTS